MSWITGLVLGIIAILGAVAYSYVKTKTAGSDAVAQAEREAREKLQEAAKAAYERKKADDVEAAKWARTDGITAGEFLKRAGLRKP